VHYRLKTPYRDGTTHILLEPLDFLARPAALVPPPRTHLTRYHGVLAPASALRAAVTAAGRGRGGHNQAGDQARPITKHSCMTWMPRLKRVFAIDIQTCRRCGGCAWSRALQKRRQIKRILAHRERRAEDDRHAPFASRAPPRLSLL
jgi:hypothetical protein